MTTVQKLFSPKNHWSHNPNTFFRHLDVSIFFNVFVENDSPSSSVPYLMDFLTIDLTVKEQVGVFKVLFKPHFLLWPISKFQLYISSYTDWYLQPECLWNSSHISHLLQHPIYNHMDILSAFQTQSIPNFISPSHKSVSITISLLLCVGLSKYLHFVNSMFNLLFNTLHCFLLFLWYPPTSPTQVQSIAKFYRLVIWFG